jgi:hypothetical protein
MATTPSPWETREFDESQTVVYGPKYDGGKRELVAIVSVGYDRPNGEDNAKLIARAPDLLAEVERLSQGIVWAHYELAEKLDDADRRWVMDLLSGLLAGKTAEEAASAARRRPD